MQRPTEPQERCLCAQCWITVLKYHQLNTTVSICPGIPLVSAMRDRHAFHPSEYTFSQTQQDFRVQSTSWLPTSQELIRSACSFSLVFYLAVHLGKNPNDSCSFQMCTRKIPFQLLQRKTSKMPGEMVQDTWPAIQTTKCTQNNTPSIDVPKCSRQNASKYKTRKRYHTFSTFILQRNAHMYKKHKETTNTGRGRQKPQALQGQHTSVASEQNIFAGYPVKSNLTTRECRICMKHIAFPTSKFKKMQIPF